jgi:hypothetical protein
MNCPFCNCPHYTVRKDNSVWCDLCQSSAPHLLQWESRVIERSLRDRLSIISKIWGKLIPDHTKHSGRRRTEDWVTFHGTQTVQQEDVVEISHALWNPAP